MQITTRHDKLPMCLPALPGSLPIGNSWACNHRIVWNIMAINHWRPPVVGHGTCGLEWMAKQYSANKNDSILTMLTTFCSLTSSCSEVDARTIELPLGHAFIKALSLNVHGIFHAGPMQQQDEIMRGPGPPENPDFLGACLLPAEWPKKDNFHIEKKSLILRFP